jgi:hypothetical protein
VHKDNAAGLKIIQKSGRDILFKKTNQDL